MVFKRLRTKISDVPIYILPWFDLQNIAGNMYKVQTVWAMQQLQHKLPVTTQKRITILSFCSTRGEQTLETIQLYHCEEKTFFQSFIYLLQSLDRVPNKNMVSNRVLSRTKIWFIIMTYFCVQMKQVCVEEWRCFYQIPYSRTQSKCSVKDTFTEMVLLSFTHSQSGNYGISLYQKFRKNNSFFFYK